MRTVLAEGELRVRSALRALVTQGLSMQLVGEADTSGGLQRLVELHHPDLAIVAWDFVAHDDVLPALRSASPGLCVVVIGLRPEMRQAALAAGADAFISKVDAPDIVIDALQACEKTEPGYASMEADPSPRAGETTVRGGLS
jgi:DNA-binding NarL/FixJ family response regulator